ncbi:MAG: hypothetical protein KDK70_03930 [Myxococcales bacterium]|nr:hypothetical protein [Myxococcales bacterium]
MAKERDLRRVLETLVRPTSPAGPRSRAEAALLRRAQAWMRSRSVCGLGLADRSTSGDRLPGTLALKVYVSDKRPRSRVRNPVPPRLRALGLEIETDVEPIGQLRAQSSCRTRRRPARPGCSIGHADGLAGTLACLVHKRGRPQPLYVLSSSHVIAPLGRAKPGDPVAQPSPVDDPHLAANTVATLRESVRLVLGAGHPNRIDAAIAELHSASHVRAELRELGLRPARWTCAIARGDLVRKVGCTTGLTHGEVLDVDFAGRVALPTAQGERMVGFSRQVLCRRFTDDGDSGALVLDAEGAVVGLHCAGTRSHSMFGRFEEVVSAFDVELA